MEGAVDIDAQHPAPDIIGHVDDLVMIKVRHRGVGDQGPDRASAGGTFKGPVDRRLIRNVGLLAEKPVRASQ